MKSRFTYSLVTFIFTSLCWIAPAGAESFDRVVSFGDSLSDTGNLSTRTYLNTGGALVVPFSPPYYATLNSPLDPVSPANPPQVRFSNGPVWTERLAENLGLPLTNYAFGGSRIGTLGTPTFDLGVAAGEPPNIVVTDNLTKQVSDYLGGGVVPGSTIYTFFSGANDFAFGLDALVADPAAFLSSTVGNLVGSIAQVAGTEAALDNGDDIYLVANLPDLSNIPLTQDTIDQIIATDPIAAAIGKPALLAGVSQSVDAFNAALIEALLGPGGVKDLTGVNIRIVDINSLLKEAASPANPFGLTNTTDPFYANDGRGLAGAQLDPGADPVTDLPGYLFFDVQHPTATMHQILGDRATALVPAPGALSYLAIGSLIAIFRRRDKNSDR